MPRVLIPETADPYLGTGVRPIVTGTGKRDLFETLPRLLQLGDAIGSSQAIGALANLGKAGIEKLKAASEAAKARGADLDRQADEDAEQKARDSDAYHEQNWKDFQAQPSMRAQEEALRVGIGEEAQRLARKDEYGAPIIGQRMDWNPEEARRVTTVYPKPPAPPENPPPQPGKAPIAPRSAQVAEKVREYNAIVDYLNANPEQNKNPLHGARLDSLKEEIRQTIKAENAASKAIYDKTAAEHARTVTDLNRQREDRDLEQRAGVRSAEIDREAAVRSTMAPGPELEISDGVVPDDVAARRTTDELERNLPEMRLTPTHKDVIRQRLQMELEENGPVAARRMADLIRRNLEAAGVKEPGGVEAPRDPSSASLLDPGKLPRQTREGVPPSAESEFYSVSRNLPPERGAVAEPPVPSKPIEPPKKRTYSDLAAEAARADTPDKQARVLQAASESKVFVPRTLFDRLSGDHDVRGMRELTNLFPRSADALGQARFLHQLERDKELSEYRKNEAEARDRRSREQLAQRKKAAEAQARKDEATLKQRIAEFEFESSDKFEETKRHNKESERIGWAAAKARADKADKDAKSSPDLPKAISVYKDRADTLDSEEARAKDAVSKADRESQAAEAAALAAKKMSAGAKPPAWDKEANAAYNKKQTELANAQAEAAAKKASAAKAKEQHEAEWGPGKPKTIERNEMRKRADKLTKELDKRAHDGESD